LCPLLDQVALLVLGHLDDGNEPRFDLLDGQGSAVGSGRELCTGGRFGGGGAPSSPFKNSNID
jgi:hypothetical protein